MTSSDDFAKVLDGLARTLAPVSKLLYSMCSASCEPEEALKAAASHTFSDAEREVILRAVDVLTSASAADANMPIPNLWTAQAKNVILTLWGLLINARAAELCGLPTPPYAQCCPGVLEPIAAPLVAFYDAAIALISQAMPSNLEME